MCCSESQSGLSTDFAGANVVGAESDPSAADRTRLSAHQGQQNSPPETPAR